MQQVAPGSRHRRDLTMFSIVSVLACNMLAFGAVFALLPKLQDKYGLATSGLGVITASSVVCSVIALLAFARFADRGHALRIMRIGIVCMCVGFGWFGIATRLWQFAAARALVGFGGGLFVPAARRTVVAREPARAGERLGMMVSVEIGGFVLGPPLAIALYTVGGLRLPFVAPVLLLVVAGMTLRVGASPRTHAAAPRGAVRLLLASPAVRAALLIGAAVNLSIGAFEPVIAKQLHDIGASDQATGLTLASFALPYVFFSWFGGRAADRFGPYRTAVLSMVFTVPTLAMFGIVKTAFLLAVFGVLRSCFDTITTPSGSAAMAHAAPATLLGTGQGLYGAIASTMTGIAALIGAATYDAWGARTLWFMSAGSMLVFAVSTTVIARRAGVWQPSDRLTSAHASNVISADPSPV